MNLHKKYLEHLNLPRNFYNRSKSKLLYEGRNSTIILILNPENEYVLKIYKKDKYNNRNRLKSELEAIKFMQSCNILNVPDIFFYDINYNYIIMQYIHGTNIKEITKTHIDQALSFIENLNQNRNRAKHIMHAAEACFNLSVLFHVIKNRIANLKHKGNDIDSIGLNKFLKQIELFVDKTEQELKEKYGNVYKDILQKNIPEKSQILSPSDFGFHNALEVNNKLFFLDFEYFGWDNPAKFIIDFILHPAMNITYELKRYFYHKCLNIFSFVEQLEIICKIFYPFLGINWILRMLNEFLPEKLFKVSDKLHEQKKIQQVQFHKAISLFNLLNSSPFLI